MKKFLLFITWPFIIYNINAQNIWTPKTDFGGEGRYESTGFSIGTKGYIGTGLTSDGTVDFWEYDKSSDTWSQKADFAGTARYGATGFSIGSKGYIGTGFTTAVVKDFWEYDPALNTWTQKADFGGVARYHSVGFSIGSKGYIGTGQNATFGYQRDFWEYDPGTNVWTKKADFAGFAKGFAAGFSIGTKGYLGTGDDVSPGLTKDFWEYDQALNSWSQEADFPGIARRSAVGFSVGTKGFMGTGWDGTNELGDFYEYDPATHAWTQKADFAGSARDGAVGFSIGTEGYIGTGADITDVTKNFFEYATTSALPVSLTNLKAYEKNAGVQIDWTTQQENNIDRYEVETSANGQQFITVGSVASKGNSSSSVEYKFFDLNSLAGVNFYRIKIIDKSNLVTYSGVLKMNIHTAFSVLTVYPNPIKGNTILLQLNLKKGIYTIKVTGRGAQLLFSKAINHSGGASTQMIELPKSLSRGVYNLSVNGESIKVVRALVKE